MQGSSACTLPTDEATRPSFVLGIVLDQRRLPQRVDQVVQHDILLYHLLMGVDSDAQAVRFRLPAQTSRYRIGAVNVHISHSIGAYTTVPSTSRYPAQRHGSSAGNTRGTDVGKNTKLYTEF